MSEGPKSASDPARPLWADAGWRAVVAAFALNGLLFGAWASRIPAFKEGFGLAEGTLGLLLLVSVFTVIEGLFFTLYEGSDPSRGAGPCPC